MEKQQSRIAKWEKLTNAKKKAVNLMTVVHPCKVLML